ncbi:FMN-binding protein [Sunxiuqinia sp. A32]|uniref:FMN-binding protein n=1 Tax=Sunxiuqinia sp. A32 TaxID=3461496 RepID=UPI004045CEB3
MKTFARLFTITLLITLGTSLLGAGSYSSSLKVIKLISKENGIDRNAISVIEIDKEIISSEYIDEAYQVKYEGSTIGFAIAAKGKGRYDPFNYLIYFNKDKGIEWIRVTAYYSNHGGQIASKKWLEQFKGFTGGELKYGEDVQAISGATLSGTSITKGIAEISTKLKSSDL